MTVRTRSRVTMLAVAGLLAGVVAPAWAAAAPAPEPRPGADKIAPGLATSLYQQEPQDFWVRFDERADTSAARDIEDWSERGWHVYNTLTETAERSQASVRAELDERGVDYQPYWIVNAIRIENGTADLAEELAANSAVRQLIPTRTYQVPKPIAGTAQAEVNAVEWGVANINADDVWSQYGVTGEGITVASIDTGTQYDHPALVGRYRGNNGDGTFDHNYNWYDAAGACDGDAPCDENGHGTHTTGTMVGDDGAGNQVGVAPGARWIEANGCCPDDAAIVASGQWFLAPRDLTDAPDTADPAKRPHVINNSWGSTSPTDAPFMPEVVQAWADAGIFGVFANGNNGPSCRTSGSPGSRTATYSVGAYDVNNKIATFSSRGTGQDGTIKPNISAPGANIRSSWPGGTYNAISGTSMATPHVAGAVALLWSAYPEMVGDIAGTRLLLDITAINTFDDQCGGDEDYNNVYGQGRLDALALVAAGATGTSRMEGVVADGNGQPLAGVQVSAQGPVSRSARTRADGSFEFQLVAGSYDMTVTGPFGYVDDRRTVTVARDTTFRHDVTLEPTERVEVSGVVLDGSGLGSPLRAEVVVTHESGFEATAVSDPETGAYRFPVVPDATYTMRVAATPPGYEPYEASITVGAEGLVRDVELVVSFVCTAPGYAVTRDGTWQRFDRNAKWQVSNVDPGYPGYDSRRGWVFDDPGERTNETGGSGRFAIVDSDHLGQHHVQDTYLTSPALDLTGRKNAAVEFGTELKAAVNSEATVELSVDGGRTWSTVWRRDGFPSVEGPSQQAVPLPTAVGKADVRLRFHYEGQWSGWWAVDDVFVGDRTCSPVS
ncbi:S8 family serine peptidase [Actinophytocola sp. NPDC049390]|uniref:S8 family serine peptidase n=1 Tax=Actinophytocola sp. NPDC049390 TaxID=3363894 RepID=UPI00379594D3